MKKWILVGGLVVAGLGAVMLLRRRTDDDWDDYDDDFMDAGPNGDSLSAAPQPVTPPALPTTEAPKPATPVASTTPAAPKEPAAPTPAAPKATATTKEPSYEAIHAVWPAVTKEEVASAGSDRDRLAGLIAEKAEQPREQVRKRLDEILAEKKASTSSTTP